MPDLIVSPDIDVLLAKTNLAEAKTYLGVTANATSITTLDGRVTTVEGNITSNDGDITALDGRVTTVEGDITTLAGRVTTAEGDITTVEGDITTLAGRVTTAEGNITSNDGDIGVLTGAVVQNETDIATNVTNIALKAPILNPTFTGTVTAPLINAGSIDFNAGAGNGGELSWNNVEKTLNLVTGSDNVTIQVGQEVVLYARNTSGLQMTDGQVVKVVGSQGNNPTIALAQADTPANARGVIGVVTQIIPNNSNGFISLIGKVRDLTLDSGTYTVGDLLYLSNTVAGGLTKVRPDIGVAIGRVIATSNGGNNAGVLEVSIDSEVAVHELEQDVIANAGAITTLQGRVTTTESNITSNDGDITALQGRVTTAESNITSNDEDIAALPFVGSFMAPNYSYSTNSNALAAGFVENQVFLNTTSHNLSGVYPDNYTLLAQYSGASAAYSLRRLSSNTTSALRIRRTGDNEEVDVLFDSNDQVSLQSSVSPTTFGTTLDEFVNTEIVTYTSDFSAGVDGWFPIQGSRSSVDDPVDAGKVLMFTINDVATQHGVGRSSLDIGSQYTLQAQVYVPSSNVYIDGMTLSDGNRSIDTVDAGIATDQWVNVAASGTSGNANIVLYPLNGGSISFQDPTGTDVFYIRNVVITDTSKNGHVTTWYDQSGNGNDATQTTAANQPKIVEGGVLVLSNGNAAIKATSNNVLNFSMASLSADGQQSTFSVLENDITSQSAFPSAFKVLSTTGAGTLPLDRRPLWLQTTTGVLNFTSGITTGYSTADRERRIYSHLTTDAAGGTATVHQDGALVDTRAVPLDANSTFSSGCILETSSSVVGAFYMSELIYYPSDQSANRVAIEANINNHYSPIAEDLYFRA